MVAQVKRRPPVYPPRYATLGRLKGSKVVGFLNRPGSHLPVTMEAIERVAREMGVTTVVDGAGKAERAEPTRRMYDPAKVSIHIDGRPLRWW